MKHKKWFESFSIPINWKEKFGNIQCIQKVFKSARHFCKFVKKNEISHWHKYLYPSLWHSHFSWSSLRRLYTLIGVHLWWIKLFGHDLERHTPVYIRSHSWQCISEQNPSHEVKGTACTQRLDCAEAQIWGRLQKDSALKVPKSTVASIILKWKKFGTTSTLPIAGRQAKLSSLFNTFVKLSTILA